MIQDAVPASMIHEADAPQRRLLDLTGSDDRP
jgi:hypothetical protein